MSKGKYQRSFSDMLSRINVNDESDQQITRNNNYK